jgi:hypothetical protein
MSPAIKEKMKQVQEAFSKVDTKTMTSKLHQAVNFMKKKMQDLKKSSENNKIAIKVNNKDAQKQITQIEKEIDSLQKKITGRQLKLDVTNNALDKIRNDTNQSVIKEMPEAGNKQIKAETYKKLDNNASYQSLVKQSDKLNSEIEKYNALLNSAKSKMAELGQQISKTSTTQNKLSSFFGAFKQKIEQVKPSLNGAKNTFSKMPSIGQNLSKITQSVTGHIRNMGGGLKNGLGHILKYAGALFSLQSIYSTLSGCAQSWLSSQNAGAKQLSANIDYMKYAMGSAFAPVIQYVTGLIYQLMKAIQSVVYALFRVNIFAKASASSYANMAGNAKKAKEETKSLSNIHSEINNVQSNDSSDGGSGGGTSPSFDLSGIDNQMSPLAQKLFDFFRPLVDSWNKYGEQVITASKNAISGIGQAVGAMWGSVETLFTNGTIYSIIANILNSIGQIGRAWANAWNNDNNGTEIIQGIANIINDLTVAILNLVSSTGFQSFLDGILSAFSGIVQFMEPVISGFIQMSEVIIEIAMSTIGDLLTLIGNALQGIGQNEMAVNILKAIGEVIAIVVAGIIAWNTVQMVLNGLMGLFTILTSPITLIILGIVAAITAIILVIQNWGIILEWLGNIWNAIVDFIVGVVTKWIEFQKAKFEFLKNIVITVFTAVKNFIVNVWNGIVNTIANVWNTIVTKVKEGVSGAWNAITSVFGNIGNWFRDKFSQAWQAVKNVFSSGGRIFDGIREGILSGLKSIVNAIIDGINKVIAIPFNGLNAALRTIKNVNIMGLSPFGWISTISVPQIPRLAKGGVLTEATTVLAGEYSGAKTNPEIVTPQNIMRDTFEDVLSDFNNSNGQPLHVTIQYLGREIFDDTIDYINSKTRRTGKNTIVTVGD